MTSGADLSRIPDDVTSYASVPVFGAPPPSLATVAPTAERVRQLLAWRGKIKPVRCPIVLPEPTEVRLELDRVFARLRGGHL